MWERLVVSTRRHLTPRLRRPGWVLLVELFIGAGWLRAVAEKVIDPAWWTGEVIRSFVAEQAGHGVGWYEPVAAEVWQPFAAPLAVIVFVLQLVAAVTLISGRRVGLGIAVGMMLNLHFVLAGAVDPSIFYLICQGALALRLLERRRDDASHEALELLNLGAVVLVATTVPMVRTLHPSGVIDDPAIVLATFGALWFLTTAAILARRSGDDGRAPAQPAASAPGPAGAFRSASPTGPGSVSSLRE